MNPQGGWQRRDTKMATTKIRVMTLKVFRAADFPDCTNGGASGRFDRIDVICDGGFPKEVDLDDAPENLFRLDVDELGGMPTAHLVPVRKRAEGLVGPMMGGNYASTSDSRWARYVASKLDPQFRFVATCLPIHDRYETPEMYDALTR